MKAGRELDALVAEKVMGWKHHGVNAHWGTDVWQCGDHAVGGYSTHHEYHFAPSDSISDAWLVIERLKSLGFLPSIHSHRNEWSCNWKASDHVYSETAPLAICIAALKAVGAL